jgi:hypothetical protein
MSLLDMNGENYIHINLENNFNIMKQYIPLFENFIKINENSDEHDEIAMTEFGMEYDQLGPDQKEWVDDEIENRCCEGPIYESEITELFEEGVKPERTKAGKLKYRDEIFPGYNKPKKYSGKGNYKFRVLAKDGDEIKVVNFGHKDYSDYTKHKDPKRRANFRKRHGCDPVKNLKKTTAKYWSCQYLW